MQRLPLSKEFGNDNLDTGVALRQSRCRRRAKRNLKRRYPAVKGSTSTSSNGKKALAIYREKFADRYVENYTMLARVIRPEADVKHSLATPKTIDELTFGPRHCQNATRSVPACSDLFI
jgi:hypothetical protein